MEKQFTSIGVAGIEVRAALAADGAEASNVGRTIVGYAAKFNVQSRMMDSFCEIIAPGAFDGVIGQDVVALFNHNDSMLLARTSAGSLKLSIDEIGLRYEFAVADDEVSERVAQYIADGRITESSFGFNVPQDGSGDFYEVTADNIVIRTITRLEFLWDVSPVTRGAYGQASVMLRSAFEARQEAEQTLKRREAEARNNRRRREIELLGGQID